MQKCMDLGWAEGRKEFGKGPIRGFKLTPQGDAVLKSAGPYVH